MKKYNKHKKYLMYPGRWQPFHEGHKEIIDRTLKEGKNVWIAIRDTEISEKNPYSTHQRLEMIKRAFGDLYGDKVIASVIPDIEGIRYGRSPGFKVEQVKSPKNVEEISATNIRKGKDNRLHERVANYINLLESTIWFTGLPCAGKTTLANRLKEELDNKEGYHTYRLDGDVVRGKGKLNEDLGFLPEDRKENLRRIAHISRMFNDNKTTVIASFVSPTNDLRNMVKEIIGEKRFKLVYVKCPLEICEKRDVKGMYKKARKGEIKDFTGIDAPFEEPQDPYIIVETDKYNVEDCLEHILTALDA